MHLEITVNGQHRSDEVEPRLLLAHYLRDVCGLRATNIGCDTTSCGACTVHVDGEAVKSCTVLAVATDGAGPAAGGVETAAVVHRGSDVYEDDARRSLLAGAGARMLDTTGRGYW